MVNELLQIPCQKIISGGQTGVDCAALDACIKLKFACGGYCPRGRMAEDGTIPENYPLEEIKQKEYKYRTLKNIQESDGTLIISDKNLIGGTLLTKQLVIEHRKPLSCISEPFNIDLICNWLKRHRIKILNVAGPRKSEWTEGYEKAYKLITDLIGIINSGTV